MDKATSRMKKSNKRDFPRLDKSGMEEGDTFTPRPSRVTQQYQIYEREKLGWISRHSRYAMGILVFHALLSKSKQDSWFFTQIEPALSVRASRERKRTNDYFNNNNTYFYCHTNALF